MYAATVAFMAVQKPVFLWFHASEAAAASAGDWWRVIAHGLSLDLTVAGYIAAIPWLLTLTSLWVPLREAVWRRVFDVYFVLIALFSAAVFAVDLALYDYWGFRIDGTILIYLADPREAMASVGLWEGVRQTAIFAAYAALMIWGYRRIVRRFSGERVRRRLPWTGVLAVLGVLFVAIRGGLTVATANVSKVYFSADMFLNHAATNPLFSLLSTLGDNEDYAAAYPFSTNPSVRRGSRRCAATAPPEPAR